MQRERPDGHAGEELKQELEARDQPTTDRQQGVAAQERGERRGVLDIEVGATLADLIPPCWFVQIN